MRKPPRLSASSSNLHRYKPVFQSRGASSTSFIRTVTFNEAERKRKVDRGVGWNVGRNAVLRDRFELVHPLSGFSLAWYCEVTGQTSPSKREPTLFSADEHVWRLSVCKSTRVKPAMSVPWTRYQSIRDSSGSTTVQGCPVRSWVQFSPFWQKNAFPEQVTSKRRKFTAPLPSTIVRDTLEINPLLIVFYSCNFVIEGVRNWLEKCLLFHI